MSEDTHQSPVEHLEKDIVKAVTDTEKVESVSSESKKEESSEHTKSGTAHSEGIKPGEAKSEKTNSDKAKSSEPFKLDDIGPWLEDVFGKKAPVLPDNFKEGVVKYYPTISVVLAAISVFLILAALPLFFILFTVGAAAGAYKDLTTFQIFGSIVGVVISIISVYLTFKAYPKLKNREKEGWKLWYQNVWVTVIGSILQFNLVGAAVAGIIWFYVVFQVKGKYTK
jgi:hypothetical protein